MGKFVLYLLKIHDIHTSKTLVHIECSKFISVKKTKVIALFCLISN